MLLLLFSTVNTATSPLELFEVSVGVEVNGEEPKGDEENNGENYAYGDFHDSDDWTAMELIVSDVISSHDSQELYAISPV